MPPKMRKVQLSGVLERREHQHLAVGVAVPVGGGILDSVADGLREFAQFAVLLRGDSGNLLAYRVQSGLVLLQVSLPKRQVQFR